MKALAWITSVVIIALNGKLVYDQISEWMAGGAPLPVTVLTIALAAALALFLAYLILLPLLLGEKGWEEGQPTGASAIIEGIATHHPKHIAAALGRDASDMAIVSQALSLAKTEGARLTLIHVVDSPSAQVYSSDVYDEHTRDDEQYLLEIAEEVRSSGVMVEIALVYGDPSRQLSAYAVSHDVDLLVLGSHGHRLLGDLLWGETVDPVRHQMAIPVLVVR